MGRKRNTEPSKPTDPVAIWMTQEQIEEIYKLRLLDRFKYIPSEDPNSFAKEAMKELIIEYATKEKVDLNQYIIRFSKMRAKNKE